MFKAINFLNTLTIFLTVAIEHATFLIGGLPKSKRRKNLQKYCTTPRLTVKLASCPGGPWHLPAFINVKIIVMASQIKERCALLLSDYCFTIKSREISRVVIYCQISPFLIEKNVIHIGMAFVCVSSLWLEQSWLLK